MIHKLTYPQIWFTYGPQTQDQTVIRELLVAGATGVRLTFSYGTAELQLRRAEQVRSISRDVGVEVFVIGDLQGEKPRLASIRNCDKIEVRKRDRVLLTVSESDAQSNIPKLPLQNHRLLGELAVGDEILEGDGAVLLRVVGMKPDGVLCDVTNDGALHPGRGLTIRKQDLRLSPLTLKDISDLEAIAMSGLFDGVAVSFVGSSTDVSKVREIIRMKGSDDLAIIAKIETPVGLENVQAIAEAADLVLAARGDLALTLPWVELPMAVEAISAASKKSATPWILATQVAEGLERFQFPTRAEICDLARWISEGAFGSMLSYETAFGPRPVDAVRATRQISERYKSVNTNAIVSLIPGIKVTKQADPLEFLKASCYTIFHVLRSIFRTLLTVQRLLKRVSRAGEVDENRPHLGPPYLQSRDEETPSLPSGGPVQ